MGFSFLKTKATYVAFSVSQLSKQSIPLACYANISLATAHFVRSCSLTLCNLSDLNHIAVLDCNIIIVI